MLKRFVFFFQRNILQILLLTAVLNGTFYIFVVPPWEHYDEPGHFEYAWLVANLPTWPSINQYDLNMRREVSASMIETQFYRDRTGAPNLLSTDPLFIGYSQTTHMPLYYFLASLPLRVFKFSDITFQLYLVRFVSLILFVFTIYCIYRACQMLFPEPHPMRWMVPFFVVFLPPFVDLMTAANNDVAVTAFSTFAIWAFIFTIKNGIRLKSVAWVFSACCLSFLSKNTGLLVSLFGLPVLILAIFKNRPFLAWALVTGGCILFVAVIFSWSSASPAAVYAEYDTYLPKREYQANAPLGNYVFAQSSQDQPEDGFYLVISPDDLEKLHDKTATLGVWIWASKPVSISAPTLQMYRAGPAQSPTVQLDTKPRFMTFTFHVPDYASVGWVWVYPPVSTNARVYWDGWVLAEGNFSENPPPQFSDPQAKKGQWGDRPFINFLENGSGEKAWPILQPLFSSVIKKVERFPSSYIWSWLDWHNIGWYYRTAGAHLFRTFWGKFSWAQVTLVGKKPFWIFIGLSLLAVLGLIIQGIRLILKKNWSVFLFLAVVVLVQFAVVLLRGAGSWFVQLYIPVARYTYPAILPTAYLLCFGWYGIAVFLRSRATLWLASGVLFMTGLVMYNAWAIYSIYNFFQ